MTRFTAKRVPSVAHRKRNAEIVSVALAEVAVGDTLVIYPHDICPVDGMALSIIGMVFAANGHLTPVAGAIPRKSSTCWRC